MEGNRNTDRTGTPLRMVITDDICKLPLATSVITIRFRREFESVFMLPPFKT